MMQRVKLKAYVTLGRFSIGHKHAPMTKLSRCRFLWRHLKHHGRLVS